MPPASADTGTFLVTGGAGFIGSHLVDALVAAGRRVIVIDNLSTGSERNLNAAAEFHHLDIGSPAAGQLIVDSRPSAVLHLAAQASVPLSVRDPLADAKTNVLGTLNLMEASRRAGDGKFLFVSSGGAIYGEPEQVPAKETTPRRPVSPYGAAKLAAEIYLESYGATYGFDYTIIRPGNVFGPRQKPDGSAGVVAIFARAMLAGQPVTIFGDGEDQRDYVYVSDAVDCIERALMRGKRTAYNVGTGVETTVNALFRGLVSLTGYAKPPHHAPARPGDLRQSTLDASRAEQDLGWRPRTPFLEGLRRTVDYFRDE